MPDSGIEVQHSGSSKTSSQIKKTDKQKAMIERFISIFIIIKENVNDHIPEVTSAFLKFNIVMLTLAF